MATTKRKSRRSRPAPPSWLGSWLRAAREEEGKQLKDVAASLKWDVSRVCRVELGKLSFDAGELPRVLAAYGLTARQFEIASKQAA